MTNIIVVFPRAEEAGTIKNLLVRNGFSVLAACTSGAQALSHADGLSGGVVLCGYKLTDMLYSELHECLPAGFEMLLLASRHYWNECIGNDIVCLAMPLKVHELVSTVGMMVENLERKRRKRRLLPKVHSQEEEALIREAKGVLMERNNMDEGEAHRYLQKCSMDSGTNLVETSQMILEMMKT